MNKKFIAITIGDINGIGIELLTKLFGRDTFQMGCAQLCGSGHSTMNKGDVFIVSKEDYQQWYFGQMWAKNSVIIDEEEEDWDEW